MKKILVKMFRLPLGAFAGLFTLGAVSSYAAEAELVPPEQDYYLHTNQRINDFHELAWVDTPGDMLVSDALTVEAWVFWEGSDLAEIQELENRNRDAMTLFCGQRANGIHCDIENLGGHQA